MTIVQPELKVGIMAEPEIRFNLISAYHLKNNEILLSGNYLAKVAGEKVQVYSESGIEASGTSVEFFPSDSGSVFEVNNVTIGINFHWEQKENQRFTGGIRLVPEDGKVRFINIVRLEDYLKSVIASEMSSTCSVALLKAHAVISRSWLLAQTEKREKQQSQEKPYLNPYYTDDIYIKWYDREDHDSFDVCADDHCQRYQGITKIHSQRSIQAVEETSGEVLTYQDQICDTRFSKCCGGISESFENAWEPVHFPYLSMIIDSESAPENFDANLVDEKNADSWIRKSPPAHCNTTDKKILSQVLPGFDQSTTDFFRWRREYSQEELSALIRKKSGHDFGDIISLEPVERGFSGRLTKLRIVGSKKTFIVGKELEIRKWLSESHLYSSAFVVDIFNVKNGTPAKFVLSGAGWGHGVGLCQIGAAVMGEEGYSYQQILKHYFKGSELKKIY